MIDLTIDNTDKSTIQGSFSKIAKDLIVNKKLKINDSVFAFIDLEFYYHHPKHRDKYADGVDHTRELGQLEMHRYGVDLSLGPKNDEDKNQGFGGILIRGLYCVDSKEVIEKSRVTRIMFNTLQAGADFSNRISIVDGKSEWTDCFTSIRVNLGKEEDEENADIFKDEPYRYCAKYKALFKKYKGKEALFRNSNLKPAEVESLLGYRLK
jgi:hypothetical protein